MPQIDSIADGAPSESLLEPGDRFAELEGGLAFYCRDSIPHRQLDEPKATIQRGDARLELDLLLRSDGKLGIGLKVLRRLRFNSLDPGSVKHLASPAAWFFLANLISSNSRGPFLFSLSQEIMADGDTYSIDLTQDDREAAKTLKANSGSVSLLFEPESVTLQGSIPFEAASMGTKRR